MSFFLHGIGVSGGIAIGRAQLVSHATLEVAHYTIASEQVEPEIERLTQALGLALDDEATRNRLRDIASDAADKSQRGPEALRALVAREIVRWTPIIKGANVTAE